MTLWRYQSRLRGQRGGGVPPTLPHSYLARYLSSSERKPVGAFSVARSHLTHFLSMYARAREDAFNSRVVPPGKWINLFELELIHLNHFRLNYFLSSVVRLSPFALSVFSTHTTHIPTGLIDLAKFNKVAGCI